MLKSKLGKSDLIVFLILVSGIVYAWANTQTYKNKRLFDAYRNGTYENFEKIPNEEPIVTELNKGFQCESYQPGEWVRVEISYFRFLIVETSEYLDVHVGSTEGAGCISEVVFRRYP